MIDVALHELPQALGDCHHGFAVSSHVRQQHTGDASGRARGQVVDIPSLVVIAVWLAVEVDVQTGCRYSRIGHATSAPDLHTLHP